MDNDKKFQLQVEIPRKNFENIYVDKKFIIENIFSKFKENIPEILKLIFINKIIQKISITNFNKLNVKELMNNLHIYDVTEKMSDKTNYTYRIGIIWNNNFDDFEFINYEKIMY